MKKISCCIAVLFLVQNLFADMVFLKDSTAIEGTILRITSDRIYITPDKQNVSTFKLSEISAYVENGKYISVNKFDTKKDTPETTIKKESKNNPETELKPINYKQPHKKSYWKTIFGIIFIGGGFWTKSMSEDNKKDSNKFKDLATLNIERSAYNSFISGAYLGDYYYTWDTYYLNWSEHYYNMSKKYYNESISNSNKALDKMRDSERNQTISYFCFGTGAVLIIYDIIQKSKEGRQYSQRTFDIKFSNNPNYPQIILTKKF